MIAANNVVACADFGCPWELSDSVYAAQSLQIANYVNERQVARRHPGDRDLVDNAAAT